MKVSVVGNSMRPTLADGDEVEVRVVPGGASARIGDVVLFLTVDKRTLLHRVCWRTREGVRTQGDAAPTADDPIPHARVLGIADLPRRPIRALVHRLATAVGARVEVGVASGIGSTRRESSR